jgi:hypothetical protein
MDPANNPDQGNSYSIRQSLQELWRGLTFFFNRSPEERVEAAHIAQPVESELEAKWREITETRKRVEELADESKSTGDLGPATQALDELKLKTANFESLVEEMQAPMRAILGRNFLGVEEWQRGFGVRVGVPPPMPEAITAELLNSKCPLHPGQLIKDTHILVLIPKTVDGKLYSAVKLGELCASRKGSGDKLIDDRSSSWKRCDWAILPQAKSEWVLLPKSDPDRNKVPEDKHFRDKTIKQQEKVYKHYAAEYREAKALEVMTMALLNDVVHGEPRILDGWNLLRCMEPNASGGRVCVGSFHAYGLRVNGDNDGCGHAYFGRALARK